MKPLISQEIMFLDKTVYIHTTENLIMNSPGDRIKVEGNYFYVCSGDKITGVFDKSIVKYIVSDGV